MTRYLLIGGALGGVVDIIWIGESASHGYPNNEAALSPGAVRTLGAVMGMAVGVGVGALVRLASGSTSGHDGKRFHLR